VSESSAGELERLRALEERHRALFANMGAGFVLYELILDGTQRAVDARLLEANPAFERLLEVEPGSLVGCSMRQVIPHFSEEWLRFIERVAFTGEPAARVDHVPERDRYFDVRAYCPRRGHAAVQIYDVTEQQHARRHVTEHDKRMEALVSSAMDAIVSLDEAQRVVLFNPAAEKMFRCEASAAIGCDFG